MMKPSWATATVPPFQISCMEVFLVLKVYSLFIHASLINKNNKKYQSFQFKKLEIFMSHLFTSQPRP